jgi:hypothetical protein
MARIKGNKLIGKVANVVYTEWNGIEVVKSLASRSKNSWTDKQELHRQRFAAINEYCGKNAFVIKTIWNLAAENRHGYNLFLSANTPAFALDGELAMVEKLHFSAGNIPLPQLFTAKRSESDPSKVEATWTEDENLPGYYSHDELMMVCGYPDRFTMPIATGVLRKSGSALIDLPEGSETITGIWLFFRGNKGEAYSGDQWFGL